jgi:hypothetical protein
MTSSALYAQQFNAHFSNPEVDNLGAPSELCVELELSYTATATLGFSNFVFDFDETVLTNPRVAQSYLNSEYDVSAVTTTALSGAGLGDVADIRLTYDFANGVDELTLTGETNCSSTTGIARVCFDVLDAGVTTDLIWVYDGSGSTTATNVNTHISSLTSTTGTQLDANSTTSGDCSLTDISIDIANTPSSGGGVSCEQFITYTSTTIGSGTYQAVDDIETVNNVTVASGSTVTLDAGNTIILRPGFVAENGSAFVARIGGCTVSLQDDELLAESRSESVFSEEMKIEVTPNPVYSEARIRFYSPAEEYVTVSIYDMNGKVVEQLHQQYAMEGWNQLTFYPKNLSSGLYFVSVQSRHTVKTERLVVQAN